MMCNWKNETDNPCSSGRGDSSRQSKSLKQSEFDKRNNFHLVKRSKSHATKELLDLHTKDLPKVDAQVDDDEYDFDDDVAVDRVTNKTTRRKRGGSNRLLETAVFLDAAAYNK